RPRRRAPGPPAVASLPGRAFPQSDPRVLGVRWLPAAAEAPATGEPPAAAAPVTLAEVAAAYIDIAQGGGAGAGQARDELLRALAAGASAEERETLQQIMVGELRT